MSNQNAINNTVDPGDKLAFRIGGTAALAIGVAYLVIIALYSSVGVPPMGGQARLQYLAGKTTTWWAIVGVSVLTNFLYVPVSISLYFALKNINRIAMLISVAFVNLFGILENAVNWTIYGALIMLSKSYAAAATESQKANLIAAANLASAILESPLAAVWAIGTISFGVLIIGLVMLKGVFNKLTAFLGILTGVLGLAAVAGVNIAIILNAIFTTIWLFFIGYKLCRLSR